MKLLATLYKPVERTYEVDAALPQEALKKVVEGNYYPMIPHLDQLLMGERIVIKCPNYLYPFLMRNDQIRIEPHRYEDCKVGEVIYCKVHGKLGVWKVHEITERGIMVSDCFDKLKGLTKSVYGKSLGRL